MTQEEIKELEGIRTIAKMASIEVFEQQKRIAEFNINLVTKPMSSISIYLVPFEDANTSRKYLEHGIRTAYDIFHTDIKELSSFLNTKELEEILELADKIYEMRKIRLVDLQEKGEIMKTFKDFLKEEDGMGTVEVILIIVVLVALVVIFKTQITRIVNSLFDKITEQTDKL